MWQAAKFKNVNASLTNRWRTCIRTPFSPCVFPSRVSSVCLQRQKQANTPHAEFPPAVHTARYKIATHSSDAVTFQQEKSNLEDLSKMRSQIFLFLFVQPNYVTLKNPSPRSHLTHGFSLPSYRHPFLHLLGEMARGHLQNPLQKLKLDLFGDARERW